MLLISKFHFFNLTFSLFIFIQQIPSILLSSLMEFVHIPRHGRATLEANMEDYEIDEYVNIPASYTICLDGEFEFKREDFSRFLQATYFGEANMVLLTFKNHGGLLAIIFSVIPLMSGYFFDS